MTYCEVMVGAERECGRPAHAVFITGPDGDESQATLCSGHIEIQRAYGSIVEEAK